MAVLEIYQDSKGKASCRTCGARITWAELVKSGKRMPFDGHELMPVRIQGGLLGDERVTELIDTDINRSHFETCPDADTHRRRR